MTKRTQEEILKRIENIKGQDFFGLQTEKLSDFLEWENAKQFYKDEFVKKVDSGEEKKPKIPDVKQTIIDYIPFAFEKAICEFGLSACRSMDYFQSWIWLDDPEFFDEIEILMTNYTDYGLPALNKIKEKYIK